MNTTVRIVLDTNILIAIISKKSPFRWLFDCIIAGEVSLCVTTDILLEYREILEQKNRVEVAENVINFITAMPTTERVKVFFAFNFISIDADDNRNGGPKFVNCAISANAHCLVSNDNHFSTLKGIDFPKVNWLTLAEFESLQRPN